MQRRKYLSNGGGQALRFVSIHAIFDGELNELEDWKVCFCYGGTLGHCLQHETDASNAVLEARGVLLGREGNDSMILFTNGP